MKTAVLSLALPALAHAAYEAAQTTFTNTKRFLFDVDGNQVDAYGAKVQWFNGTYYLYGNSFAIEGEAFGIKTYSSVDLEHWNYEGFLFDPYNDNNPCAMSGGCGRPHILYNHNTTQYVMWADAGTNGYPVATSSSPTGPFTFLETRAAFDPQFDGREPADLAIVEPGDGKAYLIFSSLTFTDPRAGSIWPPIFQTLHVSELTSDYLNTTLTSSPVTSNMTDLIDESAESPDMFLRDGKYYITASNSCGYCNGSIGLMYRSDSPQGPWTRQILAGYSCNGQVEGVLPLTNPEDGSVSYVWHSTSVPGGPRVGFTGHIFQPLQFNEDGSVQDLDCSKDAEFDVAFTRGLGDVASGDATEAGDKTPLDADYSAVCDSDIFDLFQTWTASQSGTLQSVSVNIAASIQRLPLSLTAFKFSSYEDLLSPEYKWTTLGTASYNATDLSFVFNTTSVPITSNSTIQEGDLLGLAISHQDFAPYCHLEYCTEDDSSFVLWQRGAGQNSWRGLKGNTAPAYERVGKSVKMFATYA